MAKKKVEVTPKTVKSDLVLEIKDMLNYTKDQKFPAEDELIILDSVYKILDARMLKLEAKLAPPPKKKAEKKAAPAKKVAPAKKAVKKVLKKRK